MSCDCGTVVLCPMTVTYQVDCAKCNTTAITEYRAQTGSLMMRWIPDGWQFAGGGIICPNHVISVETKALVHFLDSGRVVCGLPEAKAGEIVSVARSGAEVTCPKCKVGS